MFMKWTELLPDTSVCDFVCSVLLPLNPFYYLWNAFLYPLEQNFENGYFDKNTEQMANID